MTQHSVDSAEFLTAMRWVAHTVCVVVTDGPAGKHGATVSAFTSVSADPPTALVCLHDDSRISKRVQGNGVYRVYILPEGSESVADRFAGRHDDKIEDRFIGFDLDTNAEATVFDCKLVNAVSAGTHAICVGEVQAIKRGNGMPMAYLAGEYVSVKKSG